MNTPVNGSSHTEFATTSRGLRRGAFPMELWERAKRLGTWNPVDIDFTADAERWPEYSRAQRHFFLGSTSQFIAGEEAVALDLLPLLHTVSREGRLEEEMYLSTFLWEEAKHVDFFDCFVRAVGEEDTDLSVYQTPSYRRAFCELLPESMERLYTDPSPENQARASAVYNLGIEGIMAQAGYFSLFTVLDGPGPLPGFRKGLSLVKRDESRHIAFGVYFLSRILAEHPEVFPIIEDMSRRCLQLQIDTIDEGRGAFETTPFGMPYEELKAYAARQCETRLARVAKARGKSVAQIEIGGADFLEPDGE